MQGEVIEEEIVGVEPANHAMLRNPFLQVAQSITQETAGMVKSHALCTIWKPISGPALGLPVYAGLR